MNTWIENQGHVCVCLTCKSGTAEYHIHFQILGSEQNQTMEMMKCNVSVTNECVRRCIEGRDAPLTAGVTGSVTSENSKSTSILIIYFLLSHYFEHLDIPIITQQECVWKPDSGTWVFNINSSNSTYKIECGGGFINPNYNKTEENKSPERRRNNQIKF